MTARKRAQTRSVSRAKAVQRKESDTQLDPRCNLPNVCQYLQDLSHWLKHIDVDYKMLRLAVCNVEKQAFSGSGVDAKPPRFCERSSSEPVDPPGFGY